MPTFTNSSTGRFGTIQNWTVPSSGMYRITARGASGSGTYPGLGAVISGDFNLTAGTILRILVGQMGSGSDAWGAGGGGTFVSKVDGASANTDSQGYRVTPLIVAGGGGGSSGSSAKPDTTNASLTTSGKVGEGGYPGAGSIGYGGYAASSDYSYSGGGGGGYLTKGGDNYNYSYDWGQGGYGYLQGGTGGYGRYDRSGGFGGGGGNGYWGGGAGGGYTGGGAGRTDNWAGGGGGSYNIGTNQTAVLASTTGHGLVTIESANTPPNGPLIINGPYEDGYTINPRCPIMVKIPSDSDGDTIQIKATFWHENGSKYDQVCQFTTGFMAQNSGEMKLTPTVDLPSGHIVVDLEAYDGKAWSEPNTYDFYIDPIPNFTVKDTDVNISKENMDVLMTLLQKVREMRGLYNVNPIGTITKNTTVITKNHLEIMRSRTAEALSKIGITPSWTDPTITTGITLRKGKHWTEIFNYLKQC